MSFEKKVTYAFNMFYLEFLNDVKKQNDDLKRIVRTHFKIFDKSSAEHFNKIKASIQENKNDVNQVCLLPDMTIDDICKNMQNSESKVIMSYYHIFVVLVSLSKETDDFILEKVLDIIKNIQDGKSVDEKMNEVLDDELNAHLRNLQECFSKCSSPTDDLFGMLENSQIGSLAKEISNDINIKDLNIDNPEQLLDFRNLSSSNNVLGNIISKVSTTIQNKIEKGELSQTALVNEAMSFVGMINKGNNGSDMNIFNNPLMSELLSGFAKNTKGTKVQVNQNRVRDFDTRERLRKKLEQKNAMKKDGSTSK